ncbi:hypothetical protein R6Q59_002512 [Mikania micrantha]
MAAETSDHLLISYGCKDNLVASLQMGEVAYSSVVGNCGGDIRLLAGCILVYCLVDQ